MAEAGRGLLLDTCAIIYLAEGLGIAPEANARIEWSRREAAVFVSPISAWEIGLLARPGRARGLRFAPSPKAWFGRFLAAAGIRMAPFDHEIALDSSELPGLLHGDPAGRLLIATARHLGVPIVTRDRLILGYAETGHVDVLAC